MDRLLSGRAVKAFFGHDPVTNAPFSDGAVSAARCACIFGPPLLVAQTVDVRLTQETGPDNARAVIAEGGREPEHREWQRSFFSSVTEALGVVGSTVVLILAQVT